MPTVALYPILFIASRRIRSKNGSLSDVDRAGKATIAISVKFAKVAVHTGPVQSHSSAIVRSSGVEKIVRLI